MCMGNWGGASGGWTCCCCSEAEGLREMANESPDPPDPEPKLACSNARGGSSYVWGSSPFGASLPSGCTPCALCLLEDGREPSWLPELPSAFLLSLSFSRSLRPRPGLSSRLALRAIPTTDSAFSLGPVRLMLPAASLLAFACVRRRTRVRSARRLWSLRLIDAAGVRVRVARRSDASALPWAAACVPVSFRPN